MSCLLTAGPAPAAEAPLIEDATLSRGHAPSGLTPSLREDDAHLRVETGRAATLLAFDLSVMPDGTAGMDIAKATLRLWVNTLSIPCEVEVRPAPAPWREPAGPDLPGVAESIFHISDPAVATRLATTGGGFLTFDVTEIVRPWLDGWVPDHGLALTSGSPGCVIRFHGSENRHGAHEPRLDVALQGSFGTATSEIPLSLEGPPGPPGPDGLPGAPGPSLNPVQLALGQWYEMLETNLVYGGGSHPIGLIFDGMNVWAVSWEDDRIRKINIRHGGSEGYFFVGDGPVAVTFDGSSVWAANYLEDTVMKVRPFDGTILATVSVGDGPSGIAFDGEHVWTANRTAGTLTKIRPSDGMVLGTYPVASGPRVIAIDGTDLWVTATGDGSLVQVRTSDGAVLGSTGGMVAPIGLAYDGERIWVADWGGDAVVVFSASDGSLLQTLPGFSQPFEMVFDGYSIWVTNAGNDTVTRLRVPDGAVLATLPTQMTPEGIAFDGAHIWVGNSRSSTVNKY